MLSIDSSGTVPLEYVISSHASTEKIKQSMTHSQVVSIRSRETSTDASTVVLAKIANTSGGMARLGIQTARDATDFAFETARMSTKLGISFARGIAEGLGMSTTPVEVAEFFALTGIEISHGVTSLSLHGSAELIRVVQQFFGDSFALDLVRNVVSMVSIEVKKTGLEMGMFEMWRYFTAWVTLQKLTKEKWKVQFIYPHVSEMPLGQSSFPVKPKQNQPSNKIWNSIKHSLNVVKKGRAGSGSIDKDLPLIPIRQKSRFPSEPSKLLPKLKHFVKFANGCYGERALGVLKGNGPIRMHSSELHFYASYTGISVFDIKYMSRLETKGDIFNSDYQPRFVLSVDHSHSTIVLAFRGTLSARDVVVDLSSEPIKLAIGQSDPTLFSIHGGMLRVIANCTAPDHSSGIYSKTLELLLDYPNYSLTLTGHSLGAGLASILGVLWANPETCRTRPESGLPDREVQVLAFACPSVMDDQLGEICSDLVLSIVIGWDWLARVSHAGVLEIRDAAIKLKEAEKSTPGLLDTIISGKAVTKEEDLERLYDLRSTIARENADYDKIHPPGKIAWIYKSPFQHIDANPPKYVFYDVSHRAPVFGEIYFDEYMMKHHQPTAYDEIFDSM